MEQLQVIQSKIYEIRGQKVMLDKDLAPMYGVEVRVLNQAVKRNMDRFPPDFMFQLREEEWTSLKSQFVISSWGGIRKLSFALTDFCKSLPPVQQSLNLLIHCKFRLQI